MTQDGIIYKVYADHAVVSYHNEAYDRTMVIPSEIGGVPVTEIGTCAFKGCSELVSVHIPDSMTTIDTMAFAECLRLQTLIISEGVTTIGAAAFGACDSLISVTIPESVKVIGKSVFISCSNLESVVIRNPECEFPDRAGTFNKAVLYAEEGSTAQTYAETYNCTFVPISEAPPGEIGDVNLDGWCSVLDVVSLQKFLLNTENSMCLQNGDLTGDGIADAFDLCLLKRRLLSQEQPEQYIMMFSVYYNRASDFVNEVEIYDSLGNKYLWEADSIEERFSADDENWHSRLLEFQAESDVIRIINWKDTAEIQAFAETGAQYADSPMKDYNYAANDMGYYKLYTIYTDETGAPQYLHLCTYGDSRDCLDEPEARAFVNELSGEGYLKMTYQYE